MTRPRSASASVAHRIMMSDHPIERPPYDVAASSDTMGLHHLAVAFRDVEWPARPRDLRERYGGWRVPITGTHMHTLAELLEGVPDGSYERPERLLRAIAKAHPQLV